jgi:CheY-like chemotaxis protein
MRQSQKTCLVLVVDDEQMIEEYVQEVLERYGYKTVSFTNPTEAFAFFSRMPDAVDLIISDIKMPLINGIELTRMVVKIKPDITVILETGHPEQLDEARSIPNVRKVLEKPVLKSDLVSAVESAVKECQARKAVG